MCDDCRAVILSAACCCCFAVLFSAPGRTQEAAAPAKEMKVAAGRWKIDKSLERLRKPGAAGQHDLFWEIVHLWEKQKKSRTDGALRAVMKWLLFDAGLYGDERLKHAVFTKVPALVPALGKIILDKQVGHWAKRAAAGQRGGEPWCWPHYRSVDRKALAAAVKRAIAAGPKHNPLVRFWLAAGLLAAGDADGAKALETARQQLGRDMPHIAERTTLSLYESMATAGVPGILPVILDGAEREIAARKSIRDADWQRFSNLKRFYALLGWSLKTPYGFPDRDKVIPECRAWVKANRQKLKWDARKRQFVGGATQLGMKRFREAYAPLLEKYGFDAVKSFKRNRWPSGCLHDLAAVMSKKAKAARDADVARLMLVYAQEPQAQSRPQTVRLLLGDVSKLNPELGARLWAMLLKANLPPTMRRDPLKVLGNRVLCDAKVVEAAFALLRAEFKVDYARASAGKDPGVRMAAAMKYLFAGGRIRHDELKKLVEKAPADWDATARTGIVPRWDWVLREAGRASVLRLMLVRAELAPPSTKVDYRSPAWQFRNYVGWFDGRGKPKPSPREALAGYRVWLDKYEDKLKWNRGEKRFTGAPRSNANSLLASHPYIKKQYGLDVEAVMSKRRPDLPKLLIDIIAVMRKKPEAAKDPKMIGLAVSVVEHGRMWSSSSLVVRQHVYKALAGISEELAVKIHVLTLKKGLEGRGVACYVTPDNFRGSVMFLGSSGHARRWPVVPGAIRAKVFAAVRPDMQAAYRQAVKEKKPASERTYRVLALIYVGGSLDPLEIQHLLGDLSIEPKVRINTLYLYARKLVLSGNLNTLDLLLYCGEYDKKVRFVVQRTFDARLDGGGARFPSYGDKDRDGMRRLKYRVRWLKANRKSLVFDPKSKRFKLTAREVKPPKNKAGKDPSS
jgi:hypothetical protein